MTLAYVVYLKTRPQVPLRSIIRHKCLYWSSLPLVWSCTNYCHHEAVQLLGSGDGSWSKHIELLHLGASCPSTLWPWCSPQGVWWRHCWPLGAEDCPDFYYCPVHPISQTDIECIDSKGAVRACVFILLFFCVFIASFHIFFLLITVYRLIEAGRIFTVY